MLLLKYAFPIFYDVWCAACRNDIYFFEYMGNEDIIISLEHGASPPVPIHIELGSDFMFLKPSIRRARYSSSVFSDFMINNLWWAWY